MPDDTPILNYAPQPPRPRRTKLVLAGAAGAAGIAIAVGAWVHRPVRATPVPLAGDFADYQVNWVATRPSQSPASPGLESGRPGSDARSTPKGEKNGAPRSDSAAGR